MSARGAGAPGTTNGFASGRCVVSCSHVASGEAVMAGKGDAVTAGKGDAVTAGKGEAVTAGKGEAVMAGKDGAVMAGKGGAVMAGKGEAVMAGKGDAVTASEGITGCRVLDSFGFGLSKGKALQSRATGCVMHVGEVARPVTAVPVLAFVIQMRCGSWLAPLMATTSAVCETDATGRCSAVLTPFYANKTAGMRKRAAKQVNRCSTRNKNRTGPLSQTPNKYTRSENGNLPIPATFPGLPVPELFHSSNGLPSWAAWRKRTTWTRSTGTRRGRTTNRRHREPFLCLVVCCVYDAER